MARVVFGTVRKSDKGSFYIKFDKDVSFKAGESISLQNKAEELKSLEENRSKISEDVYQKQLERIEKKPDWIKFELIRFTKKED
jgi:hypothetical protein